MKENVSFNYFQFSRIINTTYQAILKTPVIISFHIYAILYTFELKGNEETKEYG